MSTQPRPVLLKSKWMICNMKLLKWTESPTLWYSQDKDFGRRTIQITSGIPSPLAIYITWYNTTIISMLHGCPDELSWPELAALAMKLEGSLSPFFQFLGDDCRDYKQYGKKRVSLGNFPSWLNSLKSPYYRLLSQCEYRIYNYALHVITKQRLRSSFVPSMVPSFPSLCSFP